MTIPPHIEAILQTATQSELEALIRRIDSASLIQHIKNAPHLQLLFHGFRPTHLPWKSVPAKLANDAAKNVHKKFLLLLLWQKTNEQFCEKAKSEIKEGTIEDDICQFLSRLKSGSEEVLLWALLLDERELIQSALRDGVREALTTPTSNLMLRVDCCRLTHELEKEKNQRMLLNRKVEGLEKRNSALIRNLDQADQEYGELQHQLDQKSQLEVQYRELEKQREQLSLHNISLAEELQKEKQQNQRLQGDLQALENQLAALKSSQAESDVQLQIQLDEARKSLETVLSQNQQLQVTRSRLEREIETALAKRDAEREEKEMQAKKAAKLEHDKQVLIKQLRAISPKRKLQNHEAQRDEDDTTDIPPKSAEQGLPLLAIEGAWLQAIERVSRHLQMMPTDYSTSQHMPSVQGWWRDWMDWQYLESLFVCDVLSPHSPLLREKLEDTVKAQNLLALRWYLLEWMKSDKQKAADKDIRR